MLPPSPVKRTRFLPSFTALADPAARHEFFLEEVKDAAIANDSGNVERRVVGRPRARTSRTSTLHARSRGVQQDGGRAREGRAPKFTVRLLFARHWSPA